MSTDEKMYKKFSSYKAIYFLNYTMKRNKLLICNLSYFSFRKGILHFIRSIVLKTGEQFLSDQIYDISLKTTNLTVYWL